MAELLTAAQMRAIECAAIESGRVTGLELMERAGRGVVETIWQTWPELKAVSGRAVVLCGPGNNGGDGFVVARLLKEWGWAVEAFLFGAPERLPPDARTNHARWREMGDVTPLRADARDGEEFPGRCSIVVDALFGTGLTRAVDLPLRSLTRSPASGRDHRVVAVDLPSGLCSDSGRIIGRQDEAVKADLTVTFHAMKPGHVLERGPELCGRLAVADIGLGRRVPDGARHDATDPAPVRLVEVSSVPTRTGGHKYDHGHALVLSGGVGRGGAARLAARGALRIGAGLVTVGCPPEAIPENAARLDAVMLRPVADAEALGEVLADRRFNALCVGPGLGTGAREAGLVAACLRADGPVQARPAGRAVVLDADALTLMSEDPSLFALLHGGCVLTPHAGEFARLFPDLWARLDGAVSSGPAFSRVDAVRAAAARAGCVVLLKGPATVIADPQGRCSINSAQYDRAAPGLATAGSGDVLSGFIAGLMARGVGPMQAAEAAAWLHVECARSFGPGLIAEDLPEELPKVLRALGP